MKFVFGQVGSVARQGGGVVVHGLAHKDPAHVSPPFAFDWRMRIAFLIGVLMMNAMGGYPEDGTALKGEGCANGKQVFDPLRGLIAAMSEQAVIAHADAKAAGDPPEKSCDQASLPAEVKQSGDGADMKSGHETGRNPVYFVVRCRF